MAETLLYGKSIRDYGAVGDGSSDDTEAFLKAFDGHETLICLPYGTYTVTQPLLLHSGVTVRCHKRARIRFPGLSAASGTTDIVISGGIWNCTDTENCAFDFTGVSHATLEHFTASSASDCVIGLCDCEDIRIEHAVLSSEHTASAILAGGEVSRVDLDNIVCRGCSAAIEAASGAQVNGWHVHALCSEGCDFLLTAKDAVWCNSSFCGISGQVSEQAILLEGCSLNEMAFRHLSLHDGYIRLRHNRYRRFSICDFSRLADMEADAVKPTFEISGTKCTLLCDGVTLDAIILSKKAATDAKLTAARMASPLPTSYQYTLEAALSEKAQYTLPSGGFELLTLNDA